MRNLHKAYYKDYYKNLNFNYLLGIGEEPNAEIKRRNKGFTASNLLQRIPENSLVNKTIELQIAYPGLVTGIGIGHEASIEGEFKLGLHFDWTYGMPVVYGSSVKGVLRSYFKEFCDYDNQVIDDIFEGEGKSIYDRDIFFDAVIIKADWKDRILCPDSITPHLQGPLKNPIPITFMKIAPGCVMQFRFKLVETRIHRKDEKEIVVTPDEKLEIFKTILETVGIGAKTNVGYGQLKSR